MAIVSTGAPAGEATGSARKGVFADVPFLRLITKSHLDFMAWVGWVLVTVMPFLPLALQGRYLIAAYFVLSLALHPKQMLPAMGRSWPLILLPMLMFISALWAPAPNDAIRKSVFFILTGLVPLVVAQRLTPRRIILAYILVEFLAGLASLISPNYGWNGSAAGIFGQKNWLGLHMFFLYMGGLIFMLDGKTPIFLRGFSIVAAALGAYMIYLSRSTTTEIVAAVATIALIGHHFVWAPAHRIRHLRTLIIILIVTLVLAVVLLLFGLSQVNPIDTVLGAFGKDSTLTGRTWLWEYAENVIAQHPWTGVGANGFWRPELGEANAITRAYHFKTFTYFSFHNAYYENGVQLGYPGMIATATVVAWGIYRTARIWIADQTLYNAFFLVIAAVVLIRSNAEPDLASDLNPIAILFYLGAARPMPKKVKAALHGPPEHAPPQQLPPTGLAGRFRPAPSG